MLFVIRLNSASPTSGDSPFIGFKFDFGGSVAVLVNQAKRPAQTSGKYKNHGCYWQKLIHVHFFLLS
jgi:hypothetical protein